MKKWMCSFVLMGVLYAKAFASADDCGAFFIKNGVVATFPILKKRPTWEWHKKIRPEYSWVAETGFYSTGKFKGNGFGFVAIVGTANLEDNPVQQGKIEDLISFSSKGAFLTKESKYYFDNIKKEQIQFETIVAAKVMDGESIGVMTVNKEAANMAKMGNPTHMKLTATLPGKDESYTCYPAIEIIK
ncbi:MULTISPECIES: hypothetical protein [unclassified Delftia]|uniref:hypothetical protein n=1 Tax=unclassified Delftia TaxID=2613839 RepID=UPI0012E028FE|nr:MULTISPECIES: hypothetical protein [unclassified Delftia]MDC2862978.1 hypothetical protein [Delftia sp. DT-2]